MEFLSDDNETAAQYVLLFVREAVHKLPHLKETILHSLQVSTGYDNRVVAETKWVQGGTRRIFWTLDRFCKAKAYPSFV